MCEEVGEPKRVDKKGGTLTEGGRGVINSIQIIFIFFQGTQPNTHLSRVIVHLSVVCEHSEGIGGVAGVPSPRI